MRCQNTPRCLDKSAIAAPRLAPHRARAKRKQQPSFRLRYRHSRRCAEYPNSAHRLGCAATVRHPKHRFAPQETGAQVRGGNRQKAQLRPKAARVHDTKYRAFECCQSRHRRRERTAARAVSLSMAHTGAAQFADPHGSQNSNPPPAPNQPWALPAHPCPWHRPRAPAQA